MTYAQWQYDKGIDTVKFYLKADSLENMFYNKTVLDVGCGASGKTIYYASLGVKRIIGMEILEKYKEEADQLAKEKGFFELFEFVCADAAHMPFADNSFDGIIMNDAMEHVDEPEKVLSECYRVLKPSGRLYINFPPYNHPFGAHLSDVIGIPWVHCFFSEKTLIQVYKDLVNDKPDKEERINFRISRRSEGTEYFSYINRMTLRRFDKIRKSSPFYQFYYHEEPLRPFLTFLSRLPVFKEFLVKMAVCIFEKRT